MNWRINLTLSIILLGFGILTYFLEKKVSSKNHEDLVAVTRVIPPVSSKMVQSAKKVTREPARETTNDYENVIWPDKPTLYLGAKVVKIKETKPNERGDFQRDRMVEVPEKYPLILVREKLNKDPKSGRIIYRGHEAMIADHVMIVLQNGKTEDDLKVLVTQFGGSIRKALSKNMYIVSFRAEDTDALDEAVKHFLEKTETVKVSEPDFLMSID